MAREQRFSDINRRGASRATVSRVLIVSQGEVTEPKYFSGLREEENLGRYAIEIRGKALDPVKLVKYALKAASLPEYKMIWILFDKDDSPDCQVESAIRLAKTNAKLNCALSNPCFDLWLLLHEKDVTHAIGRDDIYAQLEAKHPQYNTKKSKFIMYKDIKSGVDDAIRRARYLESFHVTEGTKPPPSTCVWRLMSMLLNRNHSCSCSEAERSCIYY